MKDYLTTKKRKFILPPKILTEHLPHHHPKTYFTTKNPTLPTKIKVYPTTQKWKFIPLSQFQNDSFSHNPT